jgi:hypothetical protein
MTTDTAKAAPTIPWTHLALALAVVMVWGSNFAVIKVALTHLPPLLFASLRFFFVAFPAVFFFKRPDVAWSRLATYGILIGLGQFGILYIAMNGQIAPGLCADLALFRTDTLAMAGAAVHDPVGALMLCSSGQADYTVVNGRVVVSAGEVTTVDIGPLIERHNALARALVQAAQTG